MLALATSTPSVITAAGAIVAALIMGVVAWRAQSAEDQRKAFQADLRDATDRVRGFIEQASDRIEESLERELDARSRGIVIGEIVRRVVREVLDSSNPTQKE